jgi:hypothetical protein
VVVKDGHEKLLSLAASTTFEVYSREKLELAVGDNDSCHEKLSSGRQTISE